MTTKQPITSPSKTKISMPWVLSVICVLMAIWLVILNQRLNDLQEGFIGITGKVERLSQALKTSRPKPAGEVPEAKVNVEEICGSFNDASWDINTKKCVLGDSVGSKVRSLGDRIDAMSQQIVQLGQGAPQTASPLPSNVKSIGYGSQTIWPDGHTECVEASGDAACRSEGRSSELICKTGTREIKTKGLSAKNHEKIWFFCKKE